MVLNLFTTFKAIGSQFRPSSLHFSHRPDDSTGFSWGKWYCAFILLKRLGMGFFPINAFMFNEVVDMIIGVTPSDEPYK